jgi:hypothetical protein
VKVYVERDGQERALKMAKNMIASHFNCSKGEKAILEIFEDRLTRSQKQNKLFWLWLTEISKETGHSKDDMADYLQSTFLGEHESMVMGKKTTKPIGTSSLKMNEFSELLEQINAWAGDMLNMKLPQPIDLYYQSMGILE